MCIGARAYLLPSTSFIGLSLSCSLKSISLGFCLLILYALIAVMGDEDGKIEGKYPIFDDLLAFIWCKMRVTPCDTLMGVVETFYKAADVVKSRDLLFRKVPDNSERRVKHRKTDAILRGIYDIMQGFPTEDPPVFVALDLNNIPFVELKNIDGAALVSQQSIMKNNIAAIQTDQEHMRSQLSRICEMLESSSIGQGSAVDGQLISATVDSSRSNENSASDRQQSGATTTPVARVVSGNTTVTRYSDVAGASRGRRAAHSAPATRGGRSTYSGVTARGGRAAATRTDFHSAGTSEPRVASREPDELSECSGTEDEGFTTQVSRNRRRRMKKVQITGRKTGTNLKSVVKLFDIFVTRLESGLSDDVLKVYVSEIINDECSVERLETRFPSYSSYKVSCDAKHREAILKPEAWPEGVLIRQYYAKPLGNRGVPLARPNGNAQNARNE